MVSTFPRGQGPPPSPHPRQHNHFADLSAASFSPSPWGKNATYLVTALACKKASVGIGRPQVSTRPHMSPVLLRGFKKKPKSYSLFMNNASCPPKDAP